MPATGLLLINLGSPDRPEPRAVRRYLREFLSDPRVLDLPAPARFLLLHFAILPFRPRRKARAYRKIWTERGSPLVVHTLDLAERLRGLLGSQAAVEAAMRYGEPSIAGALERLGAAGADRVTVLPLFPQHSSAAWGSAVEEAYRAAARLWNVPALSVVPPFYDHPAYLDVVAGQARPVLEAGPWDKVLFSFHGLPERHIRRSDASSGAHCLQRADCCDRIVPANRACYRAHCFATARGLAARLALAEGSWEVAFQSRLGREPWLRPFTDERLTQLPREGVRRLVMLCPSFTADCLETTEEIGMHGKESFLAAGGQDLRLVPCPNATEPWARAVLRIVHDAAPTGSARNSSPRPDRASS